MRQYPFHLECDLLEFSVAENLQIKKISPELREKLFGISELKKTKTGWEFIGFRDTPDAGFLTPFLLHEPLSNYILLTPDRERANDFNLAIKLLGNSSSSLFTGYGVSTPGKNYLPLCSYDTKLSPLKISEQEVSTLKKLVSQIYEHRISDEKFTILSDTYRHAMFHGIRPASRFIEFSIILEMLLLPQQNTELKYRFSLRLAKFMSKYFECSINEVFEHGKKIYDTRSNIVHSGKEKSPGALEFSTNMAHEYVRQLLIKYLENKQLFDEKKLDDLCLS